MEIPKPTESPRFNAWVVILISSIISLAAHASSSPVEYRQRSDKWVLAVTSISLVLSFAGVLMHFIKAEVFVGKYFEGGVASLILVFWVSGIPAIMKPDNCLAICSGVIYNANLYFAAWTALIATLYVWGHYGQATLGKKVADKALAAPKSAWWYALLAISIVVVAASGQLHSAYCFGRSEACTRNAFAISLGAISMVAAGVMIALAIFKKLTSVIEFATAGVIFVLFVFGIIFLTFADGSATALGNLYFAIWGGTILSGYLTNLCYKEYQEGRDAVAEAAEHAAPAPTTDDIEKGEVSVEQAVEPMEEPSEPIVKNQETVAEADDGIEKNEKILVPGVNSNE